MIGEYHKIFEWLEDEQSKYTYINRLNYLITGDFGFIKNIIDRYLTKTREEIQEYLSKLPKDRPFVLYGAGEGGRMVLYYAKEDSRFSGIFDSDCKRHKETLYGYSVKSPEELVKEDKYNIVVTTPQYFEDIRDFLKDKGIGKERLFCVNNTIFSQNAENGQYFDPDFIRFEDREVFVDAGSCDLGNSVELKEYCREVKRVYAFEPDAKSFKYCQKVSEEQFEKGVVELFDKGTWSGRAVLRFDATGDGISHITGSGSTEIETISIDEAVGEKERVTFIKMDVEGAELQSLKGAAKTIEKYRPKLAICIYHKPEDMYELPLYVKKLWPGYKLYLRHHSHGVNETVLYAIP